MSIKDGEPYGSTWAPDAAPGASGTFLLYTTHLFRSQMISGLGFPSALQVKYTVFPDVTSASCGSDVIRGRSTCKK